MRDRASSEITVWDPFVRIAHWAVALGFFIAYLTEDSMAVDVWAGYTVGVLVLARIVWGFVGLRYARFSDFVTNPVAAVRYLWDLVRAREALHRAQPLWGTTETGHSAAVDRLQL